jgi:enediyne biosynthesis protein E4
MFSMLQGRSPSRFAQFTFWVLATLLLAAGAVAQPVPDSNTSPAAARPVSVNFVDVAAKAGLTSKVVFGGVNSKSYIIETTGTGIAVFDYDNDGWPDIFVVNGTALKSSLKETGHLYRNNHDGTFSDVTVKSGITHTGWGQGVCVGDYDNDGFEDLFITYYGKNVLYHNNKNGSFTDVAEKAGVAGDGGDWGSGCAFVDYDRDGKLDLVMATYVKFDLATAPAPGERPSCMWKGAPVMCGPRGLPWASNRLFHNRGNVSFDDVTTKAHIDKTNGHYGLSVSTVDYDDDGWPDIYVACDSTPSIMYHNNHDGTFTDTAVTLGVAFNDDGREQAGMGSTIGDYDRDGGFDIFKTNFSDDTATLYHHESKVSYIDATFAAGLGLETKYLGWGTMFFDFDNDGWLDLVVANGHVYPEVDQYHLGSDYEEPRLLYRNNGDGKFTNVSAQAGAGITTKSSSRGLAIGDLWNDGRQSVIVSNMNAAPSLLVNDVKNANHWAAFRLVGTKSNRDAIGAKVSMRVGNRIFVDEVRSGSSYLSHSDMRVHFGLGTVSSVPGVQVRWPNGVSEFFKTPKIDSIVTLREGSGQSVANAGNEVKSSSPVGNRSAPI